MFPASVRQRKLIWILMYNMLSNLHIFHENQYIYSFLVKSVTKWSNVRNNFLPVPLSRLYRLPYCAIPQGILMVEASNGRVHCFSFVISSPLLENKTQQSHPLDKCLPSVWCIFRWPPNLMGNLTDISLLAEITWDGHDNSFQKLGFPLANATGPYVRISYTVISGPFISKNYLSFLQSFEVTGG